MIKVYTHKDKLKFGKHKGETVLDVVKNDPQYIIWCLSNLRSFLILDKDMCKLRKVNEEFKLNDEEEYKYLEKLDFFEMIQERTNMESDFFSPESKSENIPFTNVNRLTKDQVCFKISLKSILILKDLNEKVFVKRMDKYSHVKHLLDLILDDYNDWDTSIEKYKSQKQNCKKKASTRRHIIKYFENASDAEVPILIYNEPPITDIGSDENNGTLF